MPTLRVHFTRQDLGRTHLAARPNALWELVLSLQRLQCKPPSGPPVAAEVNEWRANALAVLAGQPLGGMVRDHLLPLAPFSSYFPDFLTPEDGCLGLEPGLDALLATPRRRLGRELDRLTTRSGAPSWGRDLATGDVSALHLLADTMRAYFATALIPLWPVIQARIAAEHTRLAAVRAAGGTEALLSSLRPVACWHSRERILETAYPVPADIHLRGRGLTLVPSWFCCGSPVALVDPELPPVLVYTLDHDPIPARDSEALANLIGSTRARILAAIGTATPTTVILRQTGISAAQLSRHVAVLRENHLVIEARHAGRSYYTRTPLGRVLTGG